MKKDIHDAGPSNLQSDRQLRSLLAPFTRIQLLDLLNNIGTRIPAAAEELRSIASSETSHRKLFIHGFGPATTSETLCAAFSSLGEIEEGTVAVNMATGRSRCFGFVTFKNIQSAEKALKNSSIRIDGRIASYSLAAAEVLDPVDDIGSKTARKLYVGSLSEDVTTTMLVSFFEQYGRIEEGAVIYDRKSNESRGFGFVTYLKAMDAKKAMADPDKFIGGKSVVVRYAFQQN